MKGDTLASNRALAPTVNNVPGKSSGGGISNAAAAKLLTNTTLIANNTQDSGDPGNGDDVSGKITAGYSLIGRIAGAIITNQGHNLLDVDPELDPAGMQANGGPTLTVALESGSPAIGAGDAAVCAAQPPSGLGGIDQRGYSRFADGDSNCDIGAYEFGASPPSEQQIAQPGSR